VENVHLILWSIYLGHYTANYIRISQVLQKIRQKHFAYLLLKYGIEIIIKNRTQCFMRQCTNAI